jgi:hypothetical protein
MKKEKKKSTIEKLLSHTAAYDYKIELSVIEGHR